MTSRLRTTCKAKVTSQALASEQIFSSDIAGDFGTFRRSGGNATGRIIPEGKPREFYDPSPEEQNVVLGERIIGADRAAPDTRR